MRANLRAVAPVSHEIRDPLARPPADPKVKLGRGAILMITATGLHLSVLVAFIAGNWISQAFAAKDPPKETATEVAVLEPEDKQKKELPPPEPELEPLPQNDPEPAFSQREESAPQPQIGISSDSTVEGGDGPAFQTGDSLAGAMPAEGLAQEILRKESKQNLGADDLVMTGDTVDTQPVPLPSNRQPVTPAKARQRGVGGFVVVRMAIGKDGSVQEVKVLQASPPGLFEDKVLEVVPTWRFTPATYKGQPVAVDRIDQTLRFEIS